MKELKKFYSMVESPIDSLLIVSDGDSLTGLYMDAHRHGTGFSADWVEDGDLPVLKATRRQLAAYFGGELTEFDLPILLGGTAFQSQVWNELTKIPFGVTISYGTLATRLGSPNSSRAVGLANGKNPVSIIVPCHRVIGANGKLVGYGGGLPRKQVLLELEARVGGTSASLF